jgi:hypothetical protein
MTKAEVVRRAIADLGRDAKPARLQGHIKTKYGIDMTAGHVKVERQKFLKRESDNGGPAAPKAPAANPAAGKAGAKPVTGKARAGGMTKREAVRRALADLGEDAPPTQLQGHIREKFGIEMTTDHISTEKGAIRKEAAAKATAIKSVSRTPAARRSAQPSAGEVEPKESAPRPPALRCSRRRARSSRRSPPPGRRLHRRATPSAWTTSRPSRTWWSGSVPKASGSSSTFWHADAPRHGLPHGPGDVADERQFAE